MNKNNLHPQRGGIEDRLKPANSWEPSPVFVRFAIIAVLLSSLAGLLFLRLLEPDQTARALGPTMLLVVSGIGWALIQRGRAQAALLVLVYGAWATVTGIVLFTGGVRAPIVIAYPVLILLTGWLISQRAAHTVAVLSVLVTLLMMLAGATGRLPDPLPTVPELQGVVHIIVYVISAFLVSFLLRGYQSRVEELHLLGRDLVDRTDDLESSKTELDRAQAVAKVGSWVFDIECDAMRLSAEACRIFGLPKGTTGGHGAYLAQVHPEDRGSVDSAWQEAFKGKGFDHEHRIVVGGDSRWVRQKAEIEFAPDGTPVRAEGIAQDISERKRSEEKIHTLAFFDQLTSLPNRTLMLDRLKQMMAASERSGLYSALLFIDLDRFKMLNDTRGHEVGDQLLKQAAQRLAQCVREGDTLARFGGDEFVVLLGNLSANRTEAAAATELVATKILGELKLGYSLGGVDHHSSASIGVTLFKGSDIALDDLLKQGDLTMYKAKAAGRNMFCFFDPALEVALNQRAAMEQDLRRAMAAQEFELHYQAQVTQDVGVCGAEVLLRWRHPQRGLVSPAQFIPLAEETGLILPLGKWVLQTACEQLAAWSGHAAMAQLSLSVNVSAPQFNEPTFVDEVLGVLAATGARPERLKLELTESLLVDNVQTIIEKMSALKAHGIGFSLDDFGTGYSSLSYLRRLPLDQLKIDQSFVRDILIDPNDAVIAKTIVALGQSLGLGVIAEGVETGAQRDALASFGCRAYQGYFFSRPIPLEAFEQYIALGP